MAGSLHQTRSRCTFKYSLFMIACLYTTCRFNHQQKRSHNNITETNHINNITETNHINNITETNHINNKTSKGNTNSITSHYIYSPIWKTIAQLKCLRSNSSTGLPTTPPNTNTNDTSQTYDLTFVPNPQNISTPERSKKTKRNTLNAILINTNSIKSIIKTTQLKTTIQSNNPDIMFLVEKTQASMEVVSS